MNIRLLQALSFVILLALSACATNVARSEVIVLPTGDGSLFRFTARQVEVVAAGKAAVVYPNQGGSRPNCAALDLGQGLAAVACAGAVAVTDLRGPAEPLWMKLEPAFASRSMALRQDRCALMGLDGTARIVQVPDGKVLWQGRAGVRLDAAFLLVPISVTEHVVIGMRGEQVLAQRVAHDRGRPELVGEMPVPDMNVFGAAATAGGAVFVAGLREEVLASSRTEAVRQHLVIKRFDLEAFRFDAVVEERIDALETSIHDLVVGQEMIALSIHMYRPRNVHTHLRVYDQVKDRRPANWTFDKVIADGSSLAWVNPNQIAAVGTDTAPEIFQVVAEPKQ